MHKSRHYGHIFGLINAKDSEDASQSNELLKERTVQKGGSNSLQIKTDLLT